MARQTIKSSGKNGQVWLQNGNTTGVSDTTALNGTAETVDGVTYDAYQVFTQATAAKIPLDASVYPTFTVGGSGAAAAYDLRWVPLRGKVIMTPAGTVSTTLAISVAATPLIYPVTAMTSFDLAVNGDYQDVSESLVNWDESVAGRSNWSGTANFFYTVPVGASASMWWNRGPGSNPQAPTYLRFYPNKNYSTEYWHGMAWIDWDYKGPISGPNTQSVKFKGVGPLVQV